MKPILMLLLVVTSFPLYADKVRRCNKGETHDVKRARSFLKANISEILSDPSISDLSRREKRVVKRKLSTRPVIKGVAIKCMDDRRVCKDRILGVERAPFNKRIVVCYQEIKSLFGNQSFCMLAETILHEIGHAARVKKGADHNQGPNGDRVYRLGQSARKICQKYGLERSLL